MSFLEHKFYSNFKPQYSIEIQTKNLHPKIYLIIVSIMSLFIQCSSEVNFQRIHTQYGYFANQGDPQIVSQMCCEVCTGVMRSEFGLPNLPQTLTIRDFGNGRILSSGLQKNAINPNSPQMQCVADPKEVTGCSCNYSSNEQVKVSVSKEELSRGIWISPDSFAVHVEGKSAPGALQKKSESLKKQTCLIDIKNNSLLSIMKNVAESKQQSFNIKSISFDFPDIYTNNCSFSDNSENCSCDVLLRKPGLKEMISSKI